MRWLDLPDELILHSFELLDIAILLTLQQTCRQIRDLIADSATLQYRIELAASGLHDGPDSHLVTAAERLRRVKAYHAAWRDLALTEVSQSQYRHSFREPVVSDNILIRFARDARTLSVTQIPSTLRNTKQLDWELKFKFKTDEVKADASQGLLIVTNVVPGGTASRVLSLFTGDVHPLCSWSGILNLPGISFYYTRICGDYVGMSVYIEAELHGRLLVWNWKTGETLVRSTLPHTHIPEYQFPAFHFLDETHVLIMSIKPVDAAFEFSLQVYNFRTASADQELAESLCGTFVFPPLAGGTTAMFFPNHASYRTDTSTSREEGVFSPDRERLVGIGIGTTHLRSLGYELYAPARTFMSPIRSGVDQPFVVPWDEWGPGHTRLRRLQETGFFGVAVHGMRAIAFHEGAKRLEVSDYHPRRVGSALGLSVIATESRKEDGQGRSVAMLEETTDTGHGIVRTTLSRLAKEMPFDFLRDFGMATTDEGLVYHKRGDDGGTQTVVLTV